MLRVGVDLQPVEEVSASLARYGTRYAARIFTDAERATCGTNALTSANSLAARFAAKEAVLKVLDTARVVPRWKEIEVRYDQGGRCELVLHGAAAELARAQGLEQWSLSVSEAGGCALAAVVARAPGARR